MKILPVEIELIASGAEPQLDLRPKPGEFS
jgi:hypothetical protein